MSTTASATEFMHAGKTDLLLPRRAGCEPLTCVYVPSLSTSPLPSSHPSCLNFLEPLKKEVTKQKIMTLQGKIPAGAKGHGAGGFTMTWLTLSCSQNCCPDYTNPVKGQCFLQMNAADSSALKTIPLKKPLSRIFPHQTLCQLLTLPRSSSTFDRHQISPVHCHAAEHKQAPKASI